MLRVTIDAHARRRGSCTAARALLVAALLLLAYVWTALVERTDVSAAVQTAPCLWDVVHSERAEAGAAQIRVKLLRNCDFQYKFDISIKNEQRFCIYLLRIGKKFKSFFLFFFIFFILKFKIFLLLVQCVAKSKRHWQR